MHITSRDTVERKESQRSRQSTNQKNDTNSVPCVSYAQKVSAGLSKNISSIADKDAAHTTLRDTIERKDGLGSGTSSVPRISYAQKVAAKLPNIKPGVEKKNISPTANNSVVHTVLGNTVEEKSDLENQYLIQGAKPKIGGGFTSCVSYAKKVLAGLPNIEPSSKRINITSTANNNVTHITLRDTVEGKGGSKDLRQGAKSKSDTSPAKGVLVRLSSIEPNSEGSSVSSIEHEGSSVITSKDMFPSSYMSLKRKPGIVNVSSDESYSTLIQPKSVSSGLYFEGVKYDASPLYKEVAIRFCGKLREFRKLHFTYCVKLVNRIFIIRNDKLVVSEPVKDLFEALTPHTEVLFFILKVFFIVNFSTLCGAMSIVAPLRYCSTHFYDQALLDLLVSKVIINSSKGNHKLKEEFEVYCKHLCNIISYEPYSGKFFQEIFNICYNLASIRLPEENQELVDFATLACMIYCGHMTGMLYRMLVYDHDAECGNPLLGYLKAQFFCNRCYNLKRAFIHMYQPADEKECPRNVGGIINVPLAIWRRCSKEIDNIVKESVSQGKMSFGVFVDHMIFSTKELILQPYTVRSYKRDVEMYDTKLQTVPSLLPLPHGRFIYPTNKSESSKSL